jgi:radical SAM protein with 4Fe4S-binding SPASM domain
MCVDRSQQTVFSDFSYQDFLELAPAVDFAASVAIYGWGEPLLNRDYNHIFSHIREQYPGIILHISSNGTLLDSSWRQRLVSATNCFLNISMNAATRETYDFVMGADLFDRAVGNLRALRDLKRETGSAFPVISLSFVMMRQNIEELPRFVELAQELEADDILISDLMVLEERHRELLLGERTTLAAAMYGEASALAAARPDGPTLTQFTDVPYLPSQHDHLCTDPWESFKVADNGGVAICCYANRFFGNIREQSLNEIWNSPDIQEYRARVNTEDPPGPCRTCPKKRGLF